MKITRLLTLLLASGALTLTTVSCKEDMVQSFMEDVDLKPTF